MPITKNALIRYHALDRCFSNPGKNYDAQALLDACNDDLYELEPDSNGIQKRQLYDDIRFMESSQGWSIELEKTKVGRSVYYRYEDSRFSIKNQPINELEAEQLKSAMMVLSRFKGLPQFEWINELLPKLDQTFHLNNNKGEVMAFDSNPFLKGIEYLGELFNAILYKKTLLISYQSFKSDEPKEFVFYPYHLKQYNKRWFLFGKNKDYTSITNMAVDRIKGIKDSSDQYIENVDIDFNSYFEDIIGVTFSDDALLTKIEIKVSKEQAHYIDSKPLHESQIRVNETDSDVVYTIEVIPNFELEKLILSHGEKMEIMAPLSFRQKIKSRIANNLENYD